MLQPLGVAANDVPVCASSKQTALLWQLHDLALLIALSHVSLPV